MKLLFLFIPICLFSQKIHLNISSIHPPKTYDNIYVKQLSTDKHTSNFVIFVKQGVKAHVHKTHSETVYVLEGEGEMRLGDKQIKVKPGDFIFIPENTVHSVKVISKTPMKVLSNQAPEFLGKDRVFIDQ